MRRVGWAALAGSGAYALAVLAVWHGETVNAIWFVIAAFAVYSIAYRFSRWKTGIRSVN